MMASESAETCRSVNIIVYKTSYVWLPYLYLMRIIIDSPTYFVKVIIESKWFLTCENEI